jgi:type IV pilus biogenesis protein CpaD/CtpE
MKKVAALLLLSLVACSSTEKIQFRKTLGVTSRSGSIIITLPFNKNNKQLNDFLNEFKKARYTKVVMNVKEETRLDSVSSYLQEELPNLRQVRMNMDRNISKREVKLALTGYDVLFPPCPDWRQPLPGDERNLSASNMGCAKSVNLGLMLDNPYDLIIEEDLSPALARNITTRSQINGKQRSSKDDSWLSGR